MKKLFLALLAFGVLFTAGCTKNDETGGTLAFGDYSYNLTCAVAVYFDDTDSDGNPVTAYNIHLLADGASVEEMSELDFTSCMLAMSLPGKTYELPEGSYQASEESCFLGVIVISMKDYYEYDVYDATLTIGRSGENYTFVVSGTAENGEQLSCNYTGPVIFRDGDSL